MTILVPTYALLLEGGHYLNRNKNVQIILFLLCVLLLVLIVNVITHLKIYIVYSSGVGPIFVIGLIIFLIILLYYQG